MDSLHGNNEIVSLFVYDFRWSEGSAVVNIEPSVLNEPGAVFFIKQEDLEEEKVSR
jgi:hypothetical protein